MQRIYTNEIFIHRDPQEVYTLLIQPEHIRGWLYTLLDWTWDGEVQSGTTFRFTVERDRYHSKISKSIAQEGKVLIANPGVEFSYTAESEAASFLNRYVLVREGDGTRLTHTLTVTPHNRLLTFMMTYLNFTMKSMPSILLHKLKEYAEASEKDRAAIAKRVEF